MKKIILFSCTTLLMSSFAYAQKKKDLLIEIEQLKSELDSTKRVLVSSKNNEKISLSKVASIQTQIDDLKETNATLLNSLSSFTESSKKKSENIGRTLQSLKEKEDQLTAINDAVTKSDSTSLAALTIFKNAIGGDATIGISNGAVTIAIPNTLLFGDSDKNYTVSEQSKGVLERIGAALNANPSLKIIVEGNSNALEFKTAKLLNNWDLSARQAAAVVSVLQNDYEVDPKRLEALGRGEFGTAGIETVTRIIIDPKFDVFHFLIRETMKGGANR